MKIGIGRYLLLALLSLALGVAGSCITPDGYKIGVPYRSQIQFNYCAAASILMWRLQGGLSEISQQQIVDFMGGPGCANQIAIRDAVNYFTLTHDAFWDYTSPTHYRDIVSRQISSIDRRTPVIAVVDYDHTGVINGGLYHEDIDYRYVWDFVYFHDPDPSIGANFKITASDWTFVYFCGGFLPSCDQIVSYSASAAWSYNLSTYGNQVVIGGGGLDPQNPD